MKKLPEVVSHPQGGYTLKVPVEGSPSAFIYEGGFGDKATALLELERWKRVHIAPRASAGQLALDFRPLR